MHALTTFVASLLYQITIVTVPRENVPVLLFSHAHFRIRHIHSSRVHHLHNRYPGIYSTTSNTEIGSIGWNEGMNEFEYAKVRSHRILSRLPEILSWSPWIPVVELPLPKLRRLASRRIVGMLRAWDGMRTHVDPCVRCSLPD